MIKFNGSVSQLTYKKIYLEIPVCTVTWYLVKLLVRSLRY